MYNKQKETILELLKSNEAHGCYENKYCVSCIDFLDPADEFTAFSCENLDGKHGYIALIERLLEVDETADVFVELYGFEEDGQPIIYADTLVIFSRLPLSEIEKIFYEPKDIFPSDIQKIADLPQKSFFVDKNGGLIPLKSISGTGRAVYCCWWD